MIDDALYHVEKDKTLRIVLPSQDRRELFESPHGGVFGGHLGSAKMHGQALLVARHVTGHHYMVLHMHAIFVPLSRWGSKFIPQAHLIM